MKKRFHYMSHSGRYLKSIYLRISIFFIIIQILFSTAVFVTTNQLEVKSNYEMNQQIFHQIANNVEQSDMVIRSLCKSLFVNPGISRMMYSNMGDEDIYEWIQEYRNLCDPILLSNPEVQSIYVYNRQMNRFFSSFRYLNFQDEYLRRLFDTEGVAPLLTPVVRYVEDPGSKQNKKTKVLTYILYDAMDSTGKPDGAIVVNVDFDKFSNEIKDLITFSKEEKSKILIFDKKDNIAFNQKAEDVPDELIGDVQQMLNAMEFSDENPFILKTEKLLGEKYGVFFSRVASMDWVIVKIQSYEEVFRNINNQKFMILFVSMVFCIIMLILTYGLARKIYSPIGQLVQKVKGNKPGDGKELNDIMFLNRAYENLIQKAMNHQKMGEQNKILLSYNLRSLLIDGNEMDAGTLETLQGENLELFQKDNEFGVCILQLDHYQEFQAKYDQKDQELFKYAVENILSEVLESSGYRNEIIPVTPDKMAVILHGEAADEKSYIETLQKCFRTANENAKKFFQITFTVAVSPYGKGMDKMRELYSIADDYLAYRYIQGHESVILYRDYNSQIDGDMEEASGILAELHRHMQDNNQVGVEKDLENLGRFIFMLSSGSLPEVITSCEVQIIHMIASKDKANKGYGGSLFLELYTKIMSLETWEGIVSELENAIETVMVQKDKQVQKTSLLVNTIQNIVSENYADCNLCVQQIAGMVKMSAQYMGRIYRGASGESVADYINNFRLAKSIEIMTVTGCNVNEVLDKVGFESESQYYRLFKKKFDTTPKAYILEQYAGYHRKQGDESHG
ncbi:AraC family transcriptional regulator [Robinsoniella sp. KNHs210]|uniref:AraC family transcriptional regulator n=1 Tax=Robinsoniella sp. KNHs210 TaxID=1469950 RepID=UPI000484D91C|nr:AraC family transcriptional regulator [Robinsoniella sp. KNHs210]